MVTDRDVADLAARIAAEFRPQRIVLFGSRATGGARPDSDVDLLVVLRFEGPAYIKAAQIRARLTASLPIDIVARTPEEMDRRYQLGDPIVREAIDRGVELFRAAA